MPDAAAASRASAAKTHDHTPTMTTAIRVLLAEDDLEARATVVELLISLGHDVVGQVGSGREAVAAAREARPDAVLLDVHMPDGSGLEAASEIVRDHPATAIVLFTGDHELHIGSTEVEQSGAVAILAKPVPPPMLDATLRMAVSRARALSRAEGAAVGARTELENRKLIERAKGLLMRRTGASEQEAYRILQRTSQDKAKPMVDIARTVIESEPKPTPKG
jgi:AmiR/NasT family two-component response regulator